MSGLVIRPARAADAALILSLVRELAEYERLLHEVAADEAGLRAALFGATPRVFCDIAEVDGAAAGFAVWYYSFSTFQGRYGIYLEDLFVRPAARGHGIGKALMANLARRCRDENLGRLEWQVLDWNASAVTFYQAQGAVLSQEWKDARLSGAALLALAEEHL